MSEVEIIDLTSPSPLPEPLDLNETPTSLGESSQNLSNPETRKKRKRRSRKSTTTSTPTDTASSSRRNSQERSNDAVTVTKRKRPNHQSLNEDDDENTKRSCKNHGKMDEVDFDNLFFVDVTPTTIPPARQTNTEKPDKVEDPGKLLVPSHVTVLGSTPVQIIRQPLAESDDEDFINYLDYDDNKHMVRYYDDPPTETAAVSRTVCKNCGAEGQHKTAACPVMICLTCGVRDEHSTRSCPISKVCFTCGMKGHINASCPNRRSARALMASRENECDRCSSSRHKTNECPTLWRLYEYFTGEEQAVTLGLRETKKNLRLGHGGEGYVGDDQWCYNCGGYGHWGDDCDDLDESHRPEEFSAFSNYNVMNGPFYDPERELKTSKTRSRPRDLSPVTDSHGWRKDAPTNVGRQARMKSKAALARQEQQVEDDPDDWFGDSSRRIAIPSRSQTSSKTFSFGKLLGEVKTYNPSASGPPSLIGRIGERQQDSKSNRSEKHDHQPHHSRKNQNADRRRRDERPSSDRYSDRHRRSDTGPRYKGGYAR